MTKEDTTERRAVAMAVADGVDIAAWSPRAKFARRYLRMARAVAESDKAAELKLIAHKPTPKMVEAATKEIELIMPMISVLAEAWDAAPWLPGEWE